MPDVEMLKKERTLIPADAEMTSTESPAGMPELKSPISRQNEVGALIGGFNRLMETLWERESELKESKSKITGLNVEIEQRVLERTSQLEAVNRELESFSYSVSHDLRAPLRHIASYSRILIEDLSDKLDPQSISCLRRIDYSCEKMGKLIDDLLQFSQNSRLELQSEFVNMNRLVQETMCMIKETNPERKIEWIIGDLPHTRGDYSLLRQVWTNLLNNAVKYTRTREEARIEVSARIDNDQTVFTVTDNGVGFDMEYAHKLFGVFQRLHTEKEFEGTGIGLATVQRIINRHGGQIWAKAEKGKGATFYFTLAGSDI